MGEKAGRMEVGKEVERRCMKKKRKKKNEKRRKKEDAGSAGFRMNMHDALQQR